MRFLILGAGGLAPGSSRRGYPTPADGDLIREMFARAGSTDGPSILWDLENGHRTEGAHTVGDMVRRADRHRILRAAVCNLQIYEVRVGVAARH
jgi:2-dehydropantoate 2-reductase